MENNTNEVRQEIEMTLIDSELKMKLEERQRNQHAEEKSNVFGAFEDLLKELQEKQRRLMYKVTLAQKYR